jgi:hypothetical protein
LDAIVFVLLDATEELLATLFSAELDCPLSAMDELEATEAEPLSELESGATAEEFGVFSVAGPEELSSPQAAKRTAAPKSKYLHFI